MSVRYPVWGGEYRCPGPVQGGGKPTLVLFGAKKYPCSGPVWSPVQEEVTWVPPPQWDLSQDFGQDYRVPPGKDLGLEARGYPSLPGEQTKNITFPRTS